MQHKALSQKEFVDRLKAGEKLFSNVILQLFDISNVNFRDVVIRDSKLIFGAFRSCDMENVVFENCDIYWLGIYNQKIQNVTFRKCKIEITVFQYIQFDSAKMDKCTLRLVAVVDSNSQSLDVSSSALSRFVTEMSQLTERDIEEITNETIGSMAGFDKWIQDRIMGILAKDIEYYDLEKPKNEGNAYKEKESSYNQSHIPYGAVRGFVESRFGSYGPSSPYKTMSSYLDKKKEKYSA